jgi:hypothetical protein
VGLNCSHLVGSHHALFEGNRANNIDGDFTHGNDIYCTYFRNYTTGYREPFLTIDGEQVNDQLNIPGNNGPLRCWWSHPYTYWTSFIGNVCGLPGVMSGWTYQNNQFGSSPGPTVLKLGWNDSAVSGAGPDPSANTIFRMRQPGLPRRAASLTPLIPARRW